MNWSARGNVLNQYLRNTSIGTTVNVLKQENVSSAAELQHSSTIRLKYDAW